jgi:hypothetical protein
MRGISHYLLTTSNFHDRQHQKNTGQNGGKDNYPFFKNGPAAQQILEFPVKEMHRIVSYYQRKNNDLTTKRNHHSRWSKNMILYTAINYN